MKRKRFKFNERSQIFWPQCMNVEFIKKKKSSAEKCVFGFKIVCVCVLSFWVFLSSLSFVYFLSNYVGLNLAKTCRKIGLYIWSCCGCENWLVANIIFTNIESSQINARQLHNLRNFNYNKKWKRQMLSKGLTCKAENRIREKRKQQNQMNKIMKTYLHHPFSDDTSHFWRNFALWIVVEIDQRRMCVFRFQ